MNVHSKEAKEYMASISDMLEVLKHIDYLEAYNGLVRASKDGHDCAHAAIARKLFLINKSDEKLSKAIDRMLTAKAKFEQVKDLDIDFNNLT